MNLKAIYDLLIKELSDYQLTKPKPWINGLIDGISGSNLIRQSLIPHKNRFAYVILDSTLEIAYKNFIVNEKKIGNFPSSKWKFRDEIEKLVKKHTNFDQEVWDEVNYFYKIRTGLYHEDSDKTVTDETVNNFQELVEFFIEKLFNVSCSELTPLTQSLISTSLKESSKIPINNIPQKINVIVVAVGESDSKTPEEIQNILKKKGFRGSINTATISTYLNHTFSYLFHKENDTWRLSEEGMTRYDDLKKTYLKGVDDE